MIDELASLGIDVTALMQFAGMAVVLVAEAFFPRRAETKTQPTRWANNLFLAFINHSFLARLSPYYFALLISAMPKELPKLLDGSGFLVSLLAVFAVFEFVGYWMHRAFHTIPWLWRLHSVHHSDTEIDATTSFRTHPLEGLIGVLVNLPVILVLQPAPQVVLIYSLVTLAMGAFSHGNLNLGRADNILRRVIVTPGFHCIHHSAERKYADSNYCNYISIYDYIFRTARSWSKDQQESLPFGLKVFRSQRDSWIDRLLMQPFRKMLPSG